MMRKNDFILSTEVVATVLTLSFPAQAQAPTTDTGWAVAKTSAGKLELKRTLGALSVIYRAEAGGDFMRVRIKPCDDDADGWFTDDDVTPEGATASEKRESVAAAIADAVQTGGLNCALPDGDDDKIMAGFDAAYDKFKAQRN